MRQFHAVSMAVFSTLGFAAGVHAAVPATPASVAAAVGDASRPDADKQRDVNRKPAEVLAFAGVKPGDRIGELMPGRGYYTKLLCKVAGSNGHVYTVNLAPNTAMRGPPPPDMPRAGGQPGAAAAPAAAPAPAPSGEACKNVSESTVKGAEFAMPASGLDLVWTSENYHDFHLDMFALASIQAFNKAIYDSLKSGGVFIVEDHAAATGSGTRDTNALHRIDPATAIQEITAVGFVLEGQSNVLANPADAHTDRVFAMGGKSDKFLLKFRKPAR